MDRSSWRPPSPFTPPVEVEVLQVPGRHARIGVDPRLSHGLRSFALLAFHDRSRVPFALPPMPIRHLVIAVLLLSAAPAFAAPAVAPLFAPFVKPAALAAPAKRPAPAVPTARPSPAGPPVM